MWTDRNDYSSILAKKHHKQGLSVADCELIEQWHENGYVILKGVIDSKLIDSYIDELSNLQEQEACPLLVTSSKFTGQRKYRPDQVAAADSIRVIDDYYFLKSSRQLLTARPIIDFLKLVFEQPPTLTQSLNFKYGSGQSLHQDTAFVRVTSPMMLAASWIALEDIKAGTGELMYMPGSHRWCDFLFSGRYTHYDEARDGTGELARWQQWLKDRASNSPKPKETFLAKKGDVLLWHGGLAHGGSPLHQMNITRKSLVGHYCPKHSRPLYHFYKPGQRKIYKAPGANYTTSYYP